MPVLKDFKCDHHGYFESRQPKCPMKGCTHEVFQVHLQAPGLVSAKTKFTDKSSKQLAIVLEANQLAERETPDYMEVDHKKMTAKFTRVPGLTEVPYPVQMEPSLVIEFYSR